MVQDQIIQLIQPSVEDLGYVLWGCEYLSQGKYSLLRVYIDSPRGIGLEDCEQVSRQISALLDVEDPITTHYSLEVSSPGIPRPLFFSEQYAQYIGEEVVVKLSKPMTGRRQWTGIVVSADAHELRLQVGQEHKVFLFSTIVKAHLTAK